MARVVKKRTSFGTSMGVSSIIAILVILVLVVFAALSITTSKADLALAQKTTDGVRAFYEADAAAEDRMLDISEVFEQGGDWREILSQKGFSVSSHESGGTLVAYTVPVDDNRNLDVELVVGESGDMIRMLWRLVPAKEYLADNSLNLVVPE